MFIVKKIISGKEYYYLRKSVREGNKVISKTVAYLGKNKEEAEKKAKEIEEKIKNNNLLDEPINNPEISNLEKKDINIDELANFCKRKGFVYPSGEIYGGLSGFWDFGPIGVELRNNIKKEWWKFHIYERDDITGIDGSIITNPKVWKASGHVDSFTDVYVKCLKCKRPNKIDKNEVGKVNCECGGEYEVISDFNLMFRTNVGPVVTDNSLAYLRPETAQLIFADFKLVQDNSRLKLPFGIAQIGKSFRNEISPRDFLFRCREFEQMEIEYFIDPEKRKDCPYFKDIEDFELNVYSEEMQIAGKEPVRMKVKDAVNQGIIKLHWHGYFLALETKWFMSLGANMNKFRIRQHLSQERSHYATDTWDLQYEFPFGWSELQGIADRGNFDLTQHEKYSNKDLKLFDEESKKKILPEVVSEPSLGVERAFLVFLFDSYYYDKKRDNIVLKLNPKLAPVKAAVFPIIKNPEYNKIAEDIVKDLRKEWNINYDKSGSIGRRYSRNDEIGTPYCITVDEESVLNKDVTIRDRDTTLQIRVKTKDLKDILRKLINNEIEFRKAGKIVKTRVKETEEKKE
ncbi:MAG: glycine--tRNA ligase [Nanoarchaeota archaeon]|nr:glycine--tRNA ligase [Nanoarchaeota archaeon]